MRNWPGISAATLVTALTLGTVLAVLVRAESTGHLTLADWSAIRFTILQALLSALISTLLAIPVARALARQQFPGRRVLIVLLGAPFILPVIVAVLGLLAVFGRTGLVSDVFGWFGLAPIQIYGMQGVILAHVFFNLPLATRLILLGWQTIPAEQFRLAAGLGFSAQDISRILERPMLRQVLPGAVMVIFVICTTSFAVALTLGGGPRATTVELAIYQAFRFDFDLGKAALLSLVQFTICTGAALVMLRIQVPQTLGTGFDRPAQQWPGNVTAVKWLDWFWIGAVSLFLILPLSMVVIRGLPGLFLLPEGLAEAAIRSMAVALCSAGISVALAYAIAVARHNMRGQMAKGLEVAGYLAIAASPLVIGTGLFILLFPITDPQRLALPITALVNAVMALPFALRTLIPAVSDVEGRFGKLADSLGLTGWARMRYLHVPRLRRPLGFVAGLAAALSMGDLGVITLFADPDGATLPLQMYRLMGSYQMEAAAGAALLLLAMSLVLFWVFDRGGHVDVDA